MQVLVDGLPDENLLAMDSTTFGSNERAFRVRFSVGGRGTATGVTLRPGEPRERQAPRVVPLPSTLAPVTDPDPALGKRDPGRHRCRATRGRGVGCRARRDARRQAGFRRRGESSVRQRRDRRLPRRRGRVGAWHSSARRRGRTSPTLPTADTSRHALPARPPHGPRDAHRLRRGAAVGTAERRRKAVTARTVTARNPRQRQFQRAPTRRARNPECREGREGAREGAAVRALLAQFGIALRNWRRSVSAIFGISRRSGFALFRSCAF